MNVGLALREARRRRRLDQATLARRAGTTQAYVSRVERGVVEPSIATLQRLLHAMGLRLHLGVEPLPPGNTRVEQLRRDLAETDASERVREAMALSSFLTSLADGSADGR